MRVLEILESSRPWEVYVGAIICYVVLFMNAAEAFSYRIDIVEIFGVRQSIVYGLIRGIGDNHLTYAEASLFFWFLTFVYAGLVLIKARRISNWLWNVS